MKTMFFEFEIKSINGNQWSFTINQGVNEYGDLTFQVHGRCVENGQTMLFDFESTKLESVLSKIENILMYEQMFEKG